MAEVLDHDRASHTAGVDRTRLLRKAFLVEDSARGQATVSRVTRSPGQTLERGEGPPPRSLGRAAVVVVVGDFVGGGLKHEEMVRNLSGAIAMAY
jgi:hypothetical protein